MMNVESLELFERCPRLFAWSRRKPTQITPLRALYAALEAGLTAEADGPASAEAHVIALAANPGLAIDAPDLYSIAVHYSKLASILVSYLRGDDAAWAKANPTPTWTPSCFQSGSLLRRIVLIDHWSDLRKMAEIRSWRTVAETSTLNQPMLLNFIAIGSTVDGRRVSPWTRALKHPRNGDMRFAKRGAKVDGFTDNWVPIWREHFEGKVLDWLGKMQTDGVFEYLVHSVKVPPARREEILVEIADIGKEIAALPADPSMRRSSCYGISPCRFIEECCTQKIPTQT